MSAAIHHVSPAMVDLSIPDELKRRRNWLVWRLTQFAGEPKPRKVPFYVSGRQRSGSQGSEADRANLATYEEAVAAQERGRYSGLGFATLPGDGIVALDFDNCITDGQIDRQVADIISGTYAEVSPSGRGIRAFMLGNLKSRKDNADASEKDADGRRKDGLFDVEFFGDTGFVTITGNPTEDCELFGLQNTLLPLTAAVQEDYRRRFKTDGQLVVRTTSEDGVDDLSDLAPETLGWTLDQVRSILFDCDPGASRDQWLKALMAVHHEMGGSVEALDLCDEWSATGANYSGRRDVEGRWRSFGRGGAAQITGRWLISWQKECNAHLKYTAVDEHRRTIAAAADEFTLREKVCREIAGDLRIDELGREALASAIQAAFLKLGSKYPIAQCRKLVVGKKERGKLSAKTPPWLQGWVYVSDEDKFFRMDSDEWLTMQGFNARFNREVQAEDDEDGNKSAAWLALDLLNAPVVTRPIYLPWADQTFEMDGVSCVNTYRLSSVPEPVGALSDTGRRAVQTILTHLNLICGGRAEVVQTMVDWMAHNVQRPGVKIRWSPLIKGIEGDGKSVLGSLMAAVMGRSNVRNVSPKVLGTDFTGWAEGSCVAVLEEIKLTGHNRYDILNALKPFLTNDSVEIHRKGQDPYDAINTTNYLAFTNHGDALPINDTDRRWLIVFSPFSDRTELAAKVREQKGRGGSDSDVLGAYFDALHDAVNTHRAELRRWLLDWPIASSFKPNGTAPHTDEKALMVGMSRSEEELAIKDLLEKGGVGFNTTIFASARLYAAYLQSGADSSLASTSWNHVLKKLGYTRLPKKVKWDGRAESIWVKGSKNLEPGVCRSELDKTLHLGGEGSGFDDLF